MTVVKGQDVVGRIDAALRDFEALELDLILDAVFPPGEQRNARIDPDLEPLDAEEEEERDRDPMWMEWMDWHGYEPMVHAYRLGDDPQGELGMATDELIEAADLIEPVTLFHRLGRIGRAPVHRDLYRDPDLYPHEVWHRLSPGQVWVGYFKHYGGGPRWIDYPWLMEEARWLEEHSEP